MEISDFNIGQLVRSTKGRDKGRIFVIVRVLDDEYVLIADGDLRKIDKPKKKKIKHLAKINVISEEIKEALYNDKKINNAFIRKELERLGVNSRD
ncbi:KOW domain-containing RNA-binding protein [Alkaliphilus pronyensis]|uniref:KOW domain-containing RNA-binding protein n=1 Tax=Alkaliphilus pronyensis TaxID=1482732 RepID=UPI001A9C2028|nr:KOW domain-containing RNA-binding protein [Alkaliphilus pronyensis]